MRLCETVAAIRSTCHRWRAEGARIALVPTMGALHEGHLSLVRMAHTHADKVIASLFINPVQFGPNEDFHAYPRDTERDMALLRAENVDALYHPHSSEMYPEGESLRLHPGPMGEILEGVHRPGFFIGVATIVAKLLIHTLPSVAIFGEKDFQQLQIIRHMVRDMGMGIDIIAAPTVREADGLAMSSRNAYLSAQERTRAPALYETLCAMREQLLAGKSMPMIVPEATDTLKRRGFRHVDYLYGANADTLAPILTLADLPPANMPLTDTQEVASGRLLGAATIGTTRLIDNIPLIR